MDTKKLLGLLFEHLENGEILSFDVMSNSIIIWFLDYDYTVIKLNQDLLTQYNKIFGYES